MAAVRVVTNNRGWVAWRSTEGLASHRMLSRLLCRKVDGVMKAGAEPSYPERKGGKLNSKTGKRLLVQLGLEPRTLALLAPRSNQLSYKTALVTNFRKCKCIYYYK